MWGWYILHSKLKLYERKDLKGVAVHVDVAEILMIAKMVVIIEIMVKGKRTSQWTLTVLKD